MLKMKEFLLLKNVAANPCSCLARNGETATARVCRYGFYDIKSEYFGQESF